MAEAKGAGGPGSGPGGGIARDQLRSIIERIERLEEEKQAIADDIKEVYAEAKANGYDTKTLRAVVRIRKQDTAERQEQEALLDLYLAALGMAVTAEAAEYAGDGGGRAGASAAQVATPSRLPSPARPGWSASREQVYLCSPRPGEETLPRFARDEQVEWTGAETKNAADLPRRFRLSRSRRISARRESRGW